MGDYLKPGDEGSFKDREKMDPNSQYCRVKDPVECPVCQGYGGWNLKVDAYGEGKHFQCMCSQCWGWGYVNKGSVDETCIHEMEEKSKKWCDDNGVYHAGNCYHVQKCTKCWKVSAYDSSG